MRPRDVLLALLVVTIWGVNAVAGKIAVHVFPPYFMMLLRFIAVAALLLPFVKAPRKQLGGIAILSAILGTVHFPMVFAGIKGTDASTASIILQLQVPIASIFAAVFFGDRLGWRRLLGMVVAFAGVFVIVGEPRLEGHTGALLTLVGASTAFALASIQIKRIGPVDGFTLNAWMALFAIPQLAVWSFMLESGQLEAVREASLMTWASLGYIVVMSTIVAYGLWYFLLGRYDVNQAVPFVLLSPVVSVVAGVTMLGEQLTWPLAIGGVMTVVGVGVIVIRRPNTVNERVSNPT